LVPAGLDGLRAPRLSVREAGGVNDGGWPDDWSDRKSGVDCPLCAALGSDSDDDHAVFVTELPSSEVRLERRSRLPGYCVVIWRHGHVAEPTELDADAAGDFWADVLAVSRAVETEFRPVKMNLLTLGNWVPHLHTHVVPRYPNDPAPGGPITWADIFNEATTPPDILRLQAAAIGARLNSTGRR
jgi:diadenosine tetraphosphate (Ap4A) HIT family hydrolase